MKRDKCCVKYCRAEPCITLPDRSRMCQEHYDRKCDAEEEMYQLQQLKKGGAR